MTDLARDAARNRSRRAARRAAIRSFFGETCEVCRAPAWSMTRRVKEPVARDRRLGTWGPADLGLTVRPDAIMSSLSGRRPLCRSCHSRHVNGTLGAREMPSRATAGRPDRASPEFRAEILRSA